MSRQSHQAVRAFPLQSSQYAAAYRSPDQFVVRGVETGLQATIAANRARAGMADQPSSCSYGAYSERQEDDGRAMVPSLGLTGVRGQPTTTDRGIKRNGPTPIGPTVIPDTSYRAPSGTSLNRVPYTARQRLELQQQQRATQERLRAKALDRKIRDAVLTQELSQRAQSAKAGGRTRPKSASAKKASQIQHRHAAQADQRMNAYVSQDELSALNRPFEPQYQQYQPQQQAQQMRGSASGPLYTATGLPVSQLGSARKPPAQQYGRYGEPADKPGQLVSQSAQSKLSAQQLADQPTAGKVSNAGAGNNLAAILGGGHEYVVFGNKNAASAQTRQPVSERAQAWGSNQQPGDESERRIAESYAPYATHTMTQARDIPARFSDPSGAVMVRDDLIREPRHASASLGYGRAHAGWTEYVAKPAAASGIARAAAGVPEQEKQNPFASSAGGAGILSWTAQMNTNPSRKEEVDRLQRELWSKTSGDYGTQEDTNGSLSRPVAGATKAPHEPLQLYYPPNGASPARPHVHGPNCGHASASPHRSPAKSTSGSGAPIRFGATSDGNPLLPYTPEELVNLTRRPSNLMASALGYGKKHPGWKTQILGAMAPGQQAQM